MGILLRREFNDVNELKTNYEFFHADKERSVVRQYREIVEGYFIYGTTSEEEFLATCDHIDNELYDDYKDMYEADTWYMDLQHYAENLQRLTGKKPGRRSRKWMYLDIKTEQD